MGWDSEPPAAEGRGVTAPTRQLCLEQTVWNYILSVKHWLKVLYAGHDLPILHDLEKVWVEVFFIFFHRFFYADRNHPSTLSWTQDTDSGWQPVSSCLLWDHPDLPALENFHKLKVSERIQLEPLKGGVDWREKSDSIRFQKKLNIPSYCVQLL